MKVLSPPAHGVLDYLLVAVLGMAPTAAGFVGAYATACYLLAAAYLLVVLFTDFPMGAVRMLPYRAHGWMELISGAVFVASPFLFGFSTKNSTARTFFIAYGAVMLLMWVLTDWSGKAHSEMDSGTDQNLEGKPL